VEYEEREMIALSIRQPWAWLILNAGKDIENRSWPTRYRGRILVHAGKGMTRDEYEDAEFFAGLCTREECSVPPFDQLARGGIVGSVEIVDCVKSSASRWFVGEYGFVLRDPVVLPFRPYRGELGFFEVRDADIAADTRSGK
jgi:hypothetical protein